VVGATYDDLRGTAVTRLAIAGSTDAEIATLTGHSLKDVHVDALTESQSGTGGKCSAEARIENKNS
jgi:hypothetical protein